MSKIKFVKPNEGEKLEKGEVRMVNEDYVSFIELSLSPSSLIIFCNSGISLAKSKNIFTVLSWTDQYKKWQYKTDGSAE